MVKWFQIALLLCSLALPARAIPQYDSPESTAAQDGTGTVWKVPAEGNSEGMLDCWQAGGWAAQAVPGMTGFRPLALTRGGDGFVDVLWQKQSQWGATTTPCLVTVQRGVGSRILARFAGPVVRDSGFPTTAAIYADTAGAVWVAGFQPLFWHIMPDGSVQTFPLKPDQNFTSPFPNTAAFSSPSLHSLIDGVGRRWFWQGQTRPGFPPSGLRGVLIWDGKALGYHPTLPGVPDHPFSVIAPLDAGHVWLATGNNYRRWPRTPQVALYRVDTRTLTAVPEAPPVPGAFQNITQIFAANGDWYAAEWYNRSPVLWRRRDGVWRKIISRREAPGGYYRPDDQHPWLAEPSGVWLGVSGGAWWLPQGDKPPLWVNWRRGVAALNISSLFPLPDGRIFAGGEQGAAEMPPTPQPVRPLPPGLVAGGLDAPAYLGPILGDPRRHLWGARTFFTPTPSLDEWDGKRWCVHLPPPGITGLADPYACDALGRIWFGDRLVYNPAQDAWTNYATRQDALAAAAALPGMALLPLLRNTFQPPVFSGDGRVAYISDNTKISYYDGKAWRQWEAQDIVPGYSSGSLQEPPRFNPGGHLEVILYNQGNSQIWEWIPESGWRQAGEQKPVTYENPVPPGGPRRLFWDIPAVDDEGRKWFVWNDAVYTAAYGLWVKQTQLSGPSSPFRYGYSIENVLRDPAGRLFFESRPAGRYDLVVWSPPPVPAPKLVVVPISEDAVRVRFGAKLAGPHWFLWRLSGGVWSAPTTEDTLTLTALARGNYRLEVEALDRHLQASPPAAAVFRIAVALETQIARWVRGLLSGTDDEREAAVAGLIKQPGTALTAIQAARPGASESGRWWLDAARQQIMEQMTEQGQIGTNGER